MNYSPLINENIETKVLWNFKKSDEIWKHRQENMKSSIKNGELEIGIKCDLWIDWGTKYMRLVKKKFKIVSPENVYWIGRAALEP